MAGWSEAGSDQTAPSLARQIRTTLPGDFPQAAGKSIPRICIRSVPRARSRGTCLVPLHRPPSSEPATMSPRKHQVLVYGPAAALDGLKARLNPYYAVHAVTYASLSGDPWEDQCAALVLVEEETPRQWGTRVRERVQTYLAEGGKVVQSVTREGAVRDVLAMDVGLGDVNVQRSAER